MGNRIKKRVRKRKPKEDVTTVANQKKDSKTNNTKRKKSKTSNGKASLFLGKLFSFFFYLATIGILVGSVLFFISKDSEKNFFGYRFYNVLTNSMIPRDPATQKGGFSAGSIIIVKMVNPKEIKENDIVTYSLLSTDPESKAVLTHRVKKIEKDMNGKEGLFFITQGDANTGEDNPVEAERLIGKKVFVIPKVASVLVFIRQNFLVSVGSLVSIFALIISIKYYISASPDKTIFEKSHTKKRKRTK